MLLLDPLDNMRHGEADQNGNPGIDPALEQFFSLHPKPGRTKECKDKIQRDMGGFTAWVPVEIHYVPSYFQKNG
jgi:hypothetical protein